MKDLYVLFAWMVITAAINALLRARTAEEWEQLAQTNPRYAAFARMLRSLGVDPVKLLQSLVDFIRGQSQKRLGSIATSEPKADVPEAPPVVVDATQTSDKEKSE